MKNLPQPMNVPQMGMMGIPQGGNSIPPEMNPQMGILQKMGGNSQGSPQENTGPNPEIQSVNLLSSAIKTVNQYAELMMEADPVNAKAARMVIAVLGEMLKLAQQDEQGKMPPPTL